MKSTKKGRRANSENYDSGYNSSSSSPEIMKKYSNFINVTVSALIEQLKESEPIYQKEKIKHLFTIYGKKVDELIDATLLEEKLYISNLPGNKGAFMLMISNSINDQSAIDELIKRINLSNKEIEELREVTTGWTVLHQLANCIVEITESGSVLNEEKKTAFYHFSERFPNLRLVKDDFDCTPEEIILRSTSQSLEDLEKYQLIIPEDFFLNLEDF